MNPPKPLRRASMGLDGLSGSGSCHFLPLTNLPPRRLSLHRLSDDFSYWWDSHRARCNTPSWPIKTIDQHALTSSAANGQISHRPRSLTNQRQEKTRNRRCGWCGALIKVILSYPHPSSSLVMQAIVDVIIILAKDHNRNNYLGILHD